MRTLSRTLPLVAATVASLALAPSAAEAQTRDGFFFGFGAGWGSLGCSDCDGERESGLGGYGKLGVAVSSRLLLGVEGAAWRKTEDDFKLTQANLSGVVYLYPTSSGFFLKGGAGLAVLEVTDPDEGDESESGLGIAAGVGYDIRVGGVSLTPYANYVTGSFDGFSTNIIQAGLGLSLY